MLKIKVTSKRDFVSRPCCFSFLRIQSQPLATCHGFFISTFKNKFHISEINTFILGVKSTVPLYCGFCVYVTFCINTPQMSYVIIGNMIYPNNLLFNFFSSMRYDMWSGKNLRQLTLLSWLFNIFMAVLYMLPLWTRCCYYRLVTSPEVWSCDDANVLEYDPYLD